MMKRPRIEIPWNKIKTNLAWDENLFFSSFATPVLVVVFLISIYYYFLLKRSILIFGCYTISTSSKVINGSEYQWFNNSCLLFKATGWNFLVGLLKGPHWGILFLEVWKNAWQIKYSSLFNMCNVKKLYFSKIFCLDHRKINIGGSRSVPLLI